MITYLLVALLVVGLAGGVGTAYYRWRALSAEKALRLLTKIEAQWRAASAGLQDRLGRAERALAKRQETERAADAVTAETASRSADAAADLLNGLHAGGPGASPGPGPELRPGPAPGVPVDDGEKLR